MKRSLSGEKVLVTSFCTFKSGSPMVAAQGRAMCKIAAMQSLNLPKVYHIGKTWYVMETIKESSGPEALRTWHWRFAEWAMQRYWYLPENWFYVKAPKFQVALLFNYIEQQGWTREMTLPQMGLLRNRYENALPRLTHGDLTHENTVIKFDQTYKFIDWQAQRHPYIAPHQDVDYGKMLQSLIGWDKNSFGSRNADRSKEIRLLLTACPMAWFWCAVHFMRIKVRAKEEWQQQVCDENIDYCSWLGETLEKVS